MLPKHRAENGFILENGKMPMLGVATYRLNADHADAKYVKDRRKRIVDADIYYMDARWSGYDDMEYFTELCYEQTWNMIHDSEHCRNIKVNVRFLSEAEYSVFEFIKKNEDDPRKAFRWLNKLAAEWVDSLAA